MAGELTLSEQTEKSGELATAGAAAAAQHEIQSAIIIARKFPRNEDACFQKLIKACSRSSFAEDATYSFPRGKKEDGTPNIVSGPSVNLAREAARVWGNIRFGLYIVHDDDETRLIRAWAWDVETNTKIEVEDDFKKLIQRKGQGWIIPDERDLRELTNRRGAIALRNAILQILPKDLIEDALFACSKAAESDAQENPEKARKKLLMDFGAVNITVEMIEKVLGHAFSQSTPKELADLRGVCKSIMDGHTTWAEYAKEPDQKQAEPSADKAKLAEAQEKLKRQQEKKETKPEPTPAEGPAEIPYTCAEACSFLRAAESPKEIAEVMNNVLRSELTHAERKQIQDAKDAAMERLSGKKKR